MATLQFSLPPSSIPNDEPHGRTHYIEPTAPTRLHENRDPLTPRHPKHIHYPPNAKYCALAERRSATPRLRFSRSAVRPPTPSPQARSPACSPSPPASGTGLKARMSKTSLKIKTKISMPNIRDRFPLTPSPSSRSFGHGRIVGHAESVSPSMPPIPKSPASPGNISPLNNRKTHVRSQRSTLNDDLDKDQPSPIDPKTWSIPPKFDEPEQSIGVLASSKHAVKNAIRRLSEHTPSLHGLSLTRSRESNHDQTRDRDGYDSLDSSPKLKRAGRLEDAEVMSKERPVRALMRASTTSFLGPLRGAALAKTVSRDGQQDNDDIDTSWGQSVHPRHQRKRSASVPSMQGAPPKESGGYGGGAKEAVRAKNVVFVGPQGPRRRLRKRGSKMMAVEWM